MPRLFFLPHYTIICNYILKNNLQKRARAEYKAIYLQKEIGLHPTSFTIQPAYSAQIIVFKK